MLSDITFSFPSQTLESKEFFEYLSRTVLELPSAHEISDGVAVEAMKPEGALPRTIFVQSICNIFGRGWRSA